MGNKIDLTGYTLISGPNGAREPITGKYSDDDLTKLLISYWVPYYDCDTCGRVDYCKFTIPFSSDSPYKKEIQCGVVVTGIKNFIHYAFPILIKNDRQAIQGFLDGIHFYSEFIFNTELTIGSAIQTYYLDSLGDFAPTFFGRIVHLRDYLNSMSISLQYIPQLHARSGVLLVEGESEQAFARRLKSSGLAWYMNIDAFSYYGKGNLSPKRIEMLLRSYVLQGYEIFVQGDADGRKSDIFDKWVEKGYVRKENTIIFRHDFESAIPPKVMFQALNSLGFLTDISEDKYIHSIGNQDEPIGGILNKEFHVSIESLKVLLAEKIADIINSFNTSRWNDSEFQKTELYNFLLFIRQANWL